MAAPAKQKTLSELRQERSLIVSSFNLIARSMDDAAVEEKASERERTSAQELLREWREERLKEIDKLLAEMQLDKKGDPELPAPAAKPKEPAVEPPAAREARERMFEVSASPTRLRNSVHSKPKPRDAKPVPHYDPVSHSLALPREFWKSFDSGLRETEY